MLLEMTAVADEVDVWLCVGVVRDPWATTVVVGLAVEVEAEAELVVACAAVDV